MVLNKLVKGQQSVNPKEVKKGQIFVTTIVYGELRKLFQMLKFKSVHITACEG